jgi:hypothetical protein
VARACGHQREFQEFEVDKYRAQRLAKFQATRCEECVARDVEEQKRAAAARPKKGEAVRMLPPGTQVTLTRRPDGTWAGRLAAGGAEVEATGDGPTGLVVALTRLWLGRQAGAGGPAG